MSSVSKPNQTTLPESLSLNPIALHIFLAMLAAPRIPTPTGSNTIRNWFTNCCSG